MRALRHWRRRLLYLAGGLALTACALWIALYLLMAHWLAKPPVLTEPPAIAQLVPQSRGDRVYLGRSWLGRREGLQVLYLTGTPFEIGYANSALTGQLIKRQEDALLTLLNHVAPYRWTQFLLKCAVTFKNRHLPENITLEQRVEILGLSRGAPDPHPELGPIYHRILNYHAAQDISCMMMNSPLIRRGCTAFGAWGNLTREGHLLTGRNFDWEPDPVFDHDRLVIICEPQEGIPFISLAWAGMVGCVSGMNRDGLSVSVNGAPSHLPDCAATPTCLVAREVLQYAHTIAEAADIIRRRRVYVSALFLVGSRRDGRFVVIEKTPDAMAIREPAGEQSIICANHFLTPALENDPINREFRDTDTSVSRYNRLQELLQHRTQPLDPAQCVAWLRDRSLPGGRFVGNGHRGSLNPLIATHAVVMDLTDGLFWAAAPPHQLGRFVAFDLSHPDRELPDRGVTEDPILKSGEYGRFQEAKARLEEGWQALKQRNYPTAESRAREAARENPGFYQNAWLLAESLFHEGRLQDAAESCQAALDGLPALAHERHKIERLSGEIAGARKSITHP